MKYKEYKLPFNSFIAGWHIPKKQCDNILNYYTNNKHLHYQGTVGRVEVKKDVKDSIDLTIGPDRFDHPFKNYRDTLQDLISLYQEKYIFVKDYFKFNIRQPYNIQHYPPGGGFKTWHFENGGYKEIIRRNLVFMTYLNDVEDGGTEFYYQKLTTPAVKGLTLIWPTSFIHTHRGIITNKEDKYIITGWFETLDI